MSFGSPTDVIYFLLLNALPESLALAMAMFSLLGLRLQAGKLLGVAGLQACSNLVLFLPINPGVHSFILIFTLGLYTFVFTRARLSRALLAALICMVIVTFSEIAYSDPLLHLTGLTIEAVRGSPFLIAAFATPYELLLLALALGKNRYNRRRGMTVGL